MGWFGWLACALPHVAQVSAEVGSPSVPAWDTWVDTPGPIEVHTTVAARWAVPLHGLVDLTDPRAGELRDGPHPIVLPVTVFDHPDHGVLVVDTGLDRAMAAGERGAPRGAVSWFLRDVDPVTSLHAIVGDRPLYRVLLTHTHIDHVLGLPDVPPGTPVIAGAGELRERGLQAALLRGTYRRLFDGVTVSALDPADAVPLGALRGWDLVGDGSVWALAAPGHTPGSTAYLARTPTGPVLAIGDTSHTRWGWDHAVPPGTYTEDHAENQRSLDALRAFAARHPSMVVLVGHE